MKKEGKIYPVFPVLARFIPSTFNLREEERQIGKIWIEIFAMDNAWLVVFLAHNVSRYGGSAPHRTLLMRKTEPKQQQKNEIRRQGTYGSGV